MSQTRRYGLAACGLLGMAVVLGVMSRGAVSAQGASRPLDTDFTIAVGQRVTVSGTPLALRLEAVVNDSRCPQDARCITAGDAEVQLSIANGKAQPRQVALHTAAALRTSGAGGVAGASGAGGGVGIGGGVRIDGGGGVNASQPMVAATTEAGFEVRLIDLAPQTRSTSQLAQKDYRVTLRVTRQVR